MFRSKKVWIILLAILVPLFSFLCIMALWLSIGVGLGVVTWLFTPNPPRPEITYGEFPFELVYEIDEEVVTVTDTFICKYDGIGMNEGVGKYREWKGYIQGTGQEGIKLFEEEGVIIWCYIGDPKYYMGEVKYLNADCIPNVVKEYPYLSGTSYTGLKADELWELYNIRIISWQFSDPVENSFD